MKRYVQAASALILAVLLAGCATVSDPAKAGWTAASGFGSRWSYQSPGTYSGEQHYTKDDYDLALSFRTEGFEKQSVAEFDRKVLDWENEDSYHKTEEALERLSASLPRDDANGEFIFRTLFTAWRECEKKHYNTCAHKSAPWYGGWAKCETKGDIFGDEVVLAGGYADFNFNYTISDEKKLTVGERDAALRQVETGMEEFLNRQDRKKLEQEEATEKMLETELKRLLKALDGGLTWAGDLDVDYWWEQAFEGTGETAAAEGGTDSIQEWGCSSAYTEEQYDLAVKSLKFDGYEDMPAGEFDRRIHAAFEGGWEEDGGELEKFLTAYEMVVSTLPETDPNYRFFQETVRDAQNEYEARAEEVYTGRRTDPEKEDTCYAEVEEDVFGDKVTVGSAEARYSFTYRILDENKLTVKERDEFLQAVKRSAQEVLEESLKDGGKRNAEEFKAGLEAAGKAAGNDRIQFTGCLVEECEVYR